MKKRAFISVSDKQGIVEFAKEIDGLGYQIISTGGTAKTLKDNGIDVTEVSEITGFPECLDGRVKTLHPKIHAGILAMREKKEHMDKLRELKIDPIDIVVVNLYPFKETIQKPEVTLEEAIENIDIGGPSMLRGAAKNWQDVTVIVDKEDYPKVIDEIKKAGEVSKETKFVLCTKVFEHTAAYDAMIAQYLQKVNRNEFPEKLTLTFEKVQDMRYGEYHHQKAVYYNKIVMPGGYLHDAVQLHGKELSYNNIGDANGALDLLREFGDEPACVAIKHANPCGVATGSTIFEAYQKAYECDPVSIFGGIVALNGAVGADTAKELEKTFLEIIIAPEFSAEALEILQQKKNIRLMKLADINKPALNEYELKTVYGGVLLQDMNTRLLDGKLSVATKRVPTEEELGDLNFAWKVVKHVKSNAIVIAKNGQTLGIGPGQTNRIWAAEIACERSGAKALGAVMASDAFFPFCDSVDVAAKAGVSAIIQPGGSIRDEESILACDRHNIAMVFTNMRHFKH